MDAVAGGTVTVRASLFLDGCAWLWQVPSAISLLGRGEVIGGGGWRGWVVQRHGRYLLDAN